MLIFWGAGLWEVHEWSESGLFVKSESESVKPDAHLLGWALLEAHAEGLQEKTDQEREPFDDNYWCYWCCADFYICEIHFWILNLGHFVEQNSLKDLGKCYLEPVSIKSHNIWDFFHYRYARLGKIASGSNPWTLLRCALCMHRYHLCCNISSYGAMSSGASPRLTINGSIVFPRKDTMILQESANIYRHTIEFLLSHSSPICVTKTTVNTIVAHKAHQFY